MFEGKIEYGSKSCCTHKELRKFQGQFDLQGQGQNYQISNTSEMFR